MLGGFTTPAFFLSLLEFFALPALWGMGFIFVKVTVPVMGTVLAPTLGVFLSGLCLWILVWMRHQQLQWSLNWKHYAFNGLIGTMFPFALFSFAANYLPTSHMAILNATMVLFTAILAIVFTNEKLTRQKGFGIILGFLGVAVLQKDFHLSTTHTSHVLWLVSSAACLLASFCYAAAALYTKQKASHVSSLNLTVGGEILGGLIFLPLAFWHYQSSGTVLEPITERVVWAFLCLAFLSTAFAYILYYRLIKRWGAVKASLTTFVTPVFSGLWGFLFLQEPITTIDVLGSFLVLLGTLFVLQLNKKA